jgi:glutamine kinase
LALNVIILGAGPPHSGEVPSALREPFSGTSVLQWLLDACDCSIDAVTFVAGYQADAIRTRYPELKVVENTEWQHTGSGASLLTSPFASESPLLVCYSDILFRNSVPKVLASCDEADIAVAWDSAWKNRYDARDGEDMACCEKVVVKDDCILRLGADLPVDWASGEFIGLVRFSPQALKVLDRLRVDYPESIRSRHLSELIEHLRIAGLSVAAVDVAGNWAEFNEPRDIAQFILGTKAETLGRLRGVVQHAVIQDLVACTVDDWLVDRDAVLRQIRQIFAGVQVAVRSSARSEDNFHGSNAGGYDSLLNVDPESGLEAAIEQVINSYGSAKRDDQVLIQSMVTNVVISGVAFTRTLEHGAPWYVVNYETNGNTEAITNGSSDDHFTLLLRRDVKCETLPEPRLAPLLSALREIEGLLNYDAFDVEFALDTDGLLHILQVRPLVTKLNNTDIDDGDINDFITTAHAQWKKLAPSPPHIPGDPQPIYGLMPDWNPAEIIGTSPGALAVSLYRHLIMDETWAEQRAEYGYRDVRPAPLLVDFMGRPYVDVRASLASFLPANLPEDLAGRLLKFNLEWLRCHPELHDKLEFEVVPTCLAPGFGNWEQRFRVDGGFTDEDIAVLRKGLHQITTNAFDRYESDLSQLETLSERFDIFQSDVRMFPLERARVLLDDCRRFGALPFAHLARSGFVAVTLLRGAVEIGIISAAAQESFLSSLRTVSHRLSEDARATAFGEIFFDTFVARYGHLRPGTYEITSPRYDAEPERFLRPLVEYAREAVVKNDCSGRWQAERSAFFAALGKLGLPSEAEQVEGFLRNAIEGREYAKFVFSRNLSAALEALAEVGSVYGLSREVLSHIPLEEMLALRHSALLDQDIKNKLKLCAAERAHSQKLSAVCELPPLIMKEADLDAFVIGSDRPNFIGSGSIIADCINLAEHSAKEPLELSGKIVLIPQADPGFDWLFGQGIAGLVTLYGGANSHMAIRAAEFGLPAVIGIGEQRYRELAQAHMLELSPPNGILRIMR